MKKERCAVSITIHDAASMTPFGKKAIAEWLREQAKSLVQEGSNYSKLFRASYRYVKGNE